MGIFDYVRCPKKTFIVHYYSKYYKFDTRTIRVSAESKKDIRNHWHSIMETDEFVIKKIDEVA